MAKINLRDIYAHYQQDCFIEVSDELAELLQQFGRAEAAYQRRLIRHKAYFSLDREDGIDRDILLLSHSPEAAYEYNITQERLCLAIAKLSEKQAKRIYAYFFLNMSQVKIAKAEGVSKESVGESIQRGLLKMQRFLQESCN